MAVKRIAACTAFLAMGACATPNGAEYVSNDRYALGSRAAAEAAVTGEGEAICRRVIRTGTLLHGTVCLSAEEWDRVRDENREALASIDQHMPQGGLPDEHHVPVVPNQGTKF